MACFRLAFKNRHVYDVIVHGHAAARDFSAPIHTARIYRVTRGVREIEPLHRTSGGPIEVYAVSERTAIAITTEILSAVTGSELAEVSTCDDPAVPGLADLA